MKNFKVITIIFVFLIAIPATSILAQHRKAPKTSSGRAAYGYPSESKSKKKHKKKSKSYRAKAKAKQPMDREKKNPWAS
ncbi:MAG: hypothetical protein ABI663_02965 [Chryseolinea sp.]